MTPTPGAIWRWGLARRGAALAAGVLAGMVAGVAPGGAAEIAADPQTVRDFMIQNVCVDAAGRAVPGTAPLGDPRCAVVRDLRPGERLPYHKHDHPSPGDAASVPLGYQRHDSIPVETAQIGTVIEHSFDFGAGEGRRFGVFDRGSDGGDVAVLSPGAVAIGATEDGGTGFALWVGQCQGPLIASALTHSWVIAEYDPAGRAPLAGATVAHLAGVKNGKQDTCPVRFAAAYTAWRIVPFRYRAAPGQGPPIVLTTLVSEHYGGANPATADHVERFYFTRELGGTRWERWQNTAGNREFSAATIAEKAAWFAGTERCSAAEPPAGAAMVLIDCREWTRIVPPGDPAGDRPGFFLDAVRTRPDAPPFFAPPAERR